MYSVWAATLVLHKFKCDEYAKTMLLSTNKILSYYNIIEQEYVFSYYLTHTVYMYGNIFRTDQAKDMGISLHDSNVD